MDKDAVNFQPRYDEARGVYRDCKWCGGKGCLACPGEADAEYRRQFPNGQEPIATFHTEDFESGGLEILRSLIGPDAIMAAKDEGAKRAAKDIKECGYLLSQCMPEMTPEQKKHAADSLGTQRAGEILVENIIAAGKKSKRRRDQKPCED